MIWKPQKREGGTPSPSRPPQTIPVRLLWPFFLSFANSATAILHSTAQPHFLTPHEPAGPGSCQHLPSSAFGGYGPHLTQVWVTGDAGAIDLGAAQDGPCTSKSQMLALSGPHLVSLRGGRVTETELAQPATVPLLPLGALLASPSAPVGFSWEYHFGVGTLQLTNVPGSSLSWPGLQGPASLAPASLFGFPLCFSDQTLSRWWTRPARGVRSALRPWLMRRLSLGLALASSPAPPLSSSPRPPPLSVSTSSS